MLKATQFCQNETDLQCVLGNLVLNDKRLPRNPSAMNS